MGMPAAERRDAALPCRPAVTGAVVAVGLCIGKMSAVVLANALAFPGTWEPGSCK